MLLTEQIETHKATENFMDALERWHNREDQEALIKPKLIQAHQAVVAAMQELGKMGSTSFAMVDTPEELSISANGRTLTVVPVAGIGLDSRLTNPRGMFCGLILFFVHDDGDTHTRLYKTLRVYSDGFCSDGTIHWVLNDTSDCALAFMAELMAETLIDSHFYWPPSAVDSEGVSTVLPIVANRADISELPKCIGFECALKDFR